MAPQITPTNSLLPMITPFVPPTSCSEHYDITSTKSSYTIDPDFVNSTSTFLISNFVNPGYLACQPTGLSSVASSVRNSFSPAVCPSGWTYYNVATVVTNGKTVTTATCCGSGDRPSIYESLNLEYNPPLCSKVYNSVRGYDNGPTSVSASVSNANSSTVFTTGTLLYPAWNIAWQRTDAPILFPAPPTPSPQSTISIWRVGDPRKGELSNSDRAEKSARDYAMFIGIPSGIVGLLTVLAVWKCVCCCQKARSKKKYKRAQAITASQPPLPLPPYS